MTDLLDEQRGHRFGESGVARCSILVGPDLFGELQCLHENLYLLPTLAI